MDASILSTLLGIAVLLPLLSFFLILVAGVKLGKNAEVISIGAIVLAAVLSFVSLFIWLSDHPPPDSASLHVGHSAAGHDESHGESAENGHTEQQSEHQVIDRWAEKTEYHGDYWVLGLFGDRAITISYYIDSLTVVMFCMVTLIASCIHFYSTGYMHEELHDVTDHEVTNSNGEALKRPGRYHRFFQYLSLFCFSMLGLVLAGNIAMVFVFWELVGICSYFLIGFYVERKSASNAANKAFIVNRVGDFGMIVGLMVIWSTLGTFAFGDKKTTLDIDEQQVASANEQQPAGLRETLIEKGVIQEADQIKISTINAEQDRRLIVHITGQDKFIDIQDEDNKPTAKVVEPGIFSLVRPHITPQSVLGDSTSTAPAQDYAHQIITPAGMVKADAEKHVQEIILSHDSDEQGRQAALAEIDEKIPQWRQKGYGYWLMVIAGVGIFCGCVGKSAMFPLHVWLPDAMEGPTPVSALVHSATMVAAGVYLVGRFFPFFVPEVLLVIAIVGCITLFLAATIAITATDIKRVLAYSTVSQLGYMMLALGLGGWVAGLLHLITHAFFKSLLFLCSGSVIHAVHTNDMTKMGGLLKKMPTTAITMLIGCLAIIGANVFIVGLSGFYSKDAILEQAFAIMRENGARTPLASIFFFAAAGGAVITAFYMFRLWFMTFLGEPRDKHRYEHAHESPRAMTVPLMILAFFAVTVAWQPLNWFKFLPFHSLSLVNLLHQARAPGTTVFTGVPEDTGTWAYTHVQGEWFSQMLWTNEFMGHDFKTPVSIIAFMAGLGGVVLAAAFYWWRVFDPADVRRSFQGLYRCLWNKWYFDELYDFLFVRPTLALSRMAAKIDRGAIDGFVDGSARLTRWVSQKWEFIADRIVVDGGVNLFANWVYSLAISFRTIQTGSIRQYVLFIVIGALAIFMLITFFWMPETAPARGP